MSLNEKIAEKMGWRSYYGKLPDPATSLNDAKLLQQKMVDDGWEIEIRNWISDLPGFPTKIYFSLSANKKTNVSAGQRFADADTEPAAIVELFKKVYGLEV